MSLTLELEEREKKWRQTVLSPIKYEQPKEIRGVPYDTFMKFYHLCPTWAIRYKEHTLKEHWNSMSSPSRCVMGEFSGWQAGWGADKCPTCHEFGFSGTNDRPGFYRNDCGFRWKDTIMNFVAHVQKAHPERLR